MLLCISFIVFTVSPAFTRFLSVNACTSDEFRCQDGGCVPLTNLCDGNRDCFDGTDELTCVMNPIRSVYNRFKRQAAICRSDEFRCQDGGCVPLTSLCDGNRDCFDGADEISCNDIQNECGTITPGGEQPVLGGQEAKRGELPWHVAIYSKNYIPYRQICGGSLITTTTIISSANCFWSYTKEPASDYAVAVGKTYRTWDDIHDADAQKSDVATIKVPLRFRGFATNYQDDIALVIVATPFTFGTYVRPVCVDFDVKFDRTQLTNGALGKVGGWGLSEKGPASQVLNVVGIPYVEIQECFAILPPSFREYITSDKICAGYMNGPLLCPSESGGGLVFPVIEQGTQRYYLRGVVSTAPRYEDMCNGNTLAAFTHIIAHEHFIKDFII